MFYNGRNPLKFYKNKNVLYVLEPNEDANQLGPAGSHPIPYKEPVVIEPELSGGGSSDGSSENPGDPVYYDSFTGNFGDSDATNILPPTKDVSLRDNIESNISLVIILVLVMIIGYILRKDNSRKKEVQELTRQLNEAKNNQD